MSTPVLHIPAAGNGVADIDPVQPVGPDAGGFIRGMGWAPDLPDIRDYSPEHQEVAPLLAGIGLETTQANTPTKVDLRQYFSPIEDQREIGSCTANAGAGIVEYYQRRAYNKHLDASRLFLYKATRNLMGWHGDTGAYLRTTMGALCLFGVAPESLWPYDTSKFDEEPPAFLYALAQSYQAEKFYRLDPSGTSVNDLLTSIKQHLAKGLPPMFGFTVYESIRRPVKAGDIPFPSTSEKVLGGHAIVAVGYDDNAKVKSPTTGATTTGALIIRNSWGTSWGFGGYGLLPYEYVRQGLAQDWWVLISAEWLDQDPFHP